MKNIITPLMALAFFFQAQAQYMITTVAGNGSWGFSGDGGQATAARLAGPSGLALDAQGNIFIADQTIQRVRKVTASTGVINTLADNGLGGYSGDGGAATSSQLHSPFGVGVDSQGNIYIADWSNYRVRKVNAITGIITTVAGNGIYSFSGDGAVATSAGLSAPCGVVVDTQGNIYIADSGNNRISRVDAITGIITTIAGNGTPSYSGDGGPATTAGIRYPVGLTIDAQGHLLIADRNNHRIRKINLSTGIITTVAGIGTPAFSGDGGQATIAALNFPTGVASDAQGNLYVADKDNHRIRIVNATGIISTLAGNGFTTTNQSSQVIGSYSGDVGPAIAASLNYPTSLAINAQGEIFIADHYNARIRKLTHCIGTSVTASASQYTICSGQSVSLSASGATSYTWNTGQTGSIVPYLLPLVSTNYYVASSNSVGCSMASISIVLNTTPTLSMNNYTVCTGYSLAVTPTLMPGGTNYTLTTLSGTTNVLTISAAETSMIPHGNNPYTLPYTNVGETPQGCLSNNFVFLVTFNQTPKITVNNPVVCLNESAVITPSGAASYTITGGNYTVNTSAVCVTNYTISSISDAGCLGSEVATVSV